MKSKLVFLFGLVCEIPKIIWFCCLCCFVAIRYWNYYSQSVALSWRAKVPIMVVFVYLFPRHVYCRHYYGLVFRFLVIMRIGDELFDRHVDGNSAQKQQAQGCLQNLSYALRNSEVKIARLVACFSDYFALHSVKYIRFKQPLSRVLQALLKTRFVGVRQWIVDSLKLFVRVQQLEFDVAEEKALYEELFYETTVTLAQQQLQVCVGDNAARDSSFVLLCGLVGFLDDVKDYHEDILAGRPNFFSHFDGSLIDAVQKWKKEYTQTRDEFVRLRYGPARFMTSMLQVFYVGFSSPSKLILQ